MTLIFNPCSKINLLLRLFTVTVSITGKISKKRLLLPRGITPQSGVISPVRDAISPISLLSPPLVMTVLMLSVE